MPELLDAQGNPVSTQAADPAPTAEPKPAAAEDVTALRAQLGGLQDTIAQLKGVIEYGVNAAAATGAARDAVAFAEPDITDDEINAAISNEQNPAKVIRRLVDKQTRSLEQRAAQELGAIRQSGFSSIARLVEGTVTAEPHFKAYEKEIRQFVGALPQEAQINPDVWKVAYNAVVGAHAGEIVAREVEAARRQGRTEAGKANLPSQTGATLTAQDGSTVTAPEELADVQWLSEKGQTPDAFAQKLGHGKRGARYTDWADYMKKSTVKRDDPKAKPDDGARLGGGF